MWEPQVKILSGRLRMIPFDHRGHGASPVPAAPYTIAELGHDVIALMDHLKLERASYCGLSIGGMVGQWLAGKPSRAHRQADPDRYHGIPGRARAVVGARRDGARGGHGRGDRRPGRRALVHAAWAAAHGHTVRAYREMLAATPVEGYAGCCEAIAELDLRDELERITAPTLVISGAEDPSIPPPHQQAIADAVAGARLETIADAAHLPSVQHPALVNQLIFDHLGL